MDSSANSSPETLAQQFVSTDLLREKIRQYSKAQREKVRANAIDSFRFGLGEIQAQIQELHDLTEKDVSGLAARIKRRKHATEEDMYRLSHAFLQGIENIRAFGKIPGAIQVLVKEYTGKNSSRQVSASECLCNLSLGEAPVCDKIATMAGSYLVTYLDSTEERLKRCSLWTLGNILATGGKGAQTLLKMELVHKLWNLYACDTSITVDSDYRNDAAICLQLISMQATKLLSQQDKLYITEKLTLKNPTCVAGEYHLQIVFDCEIVNEKCSLNDEQLLYLINYALSNLSQSQDFETSANRLRIIYAVRIVANLMATYKWQAYNILLQQLCTVWQTNLVSLLNKLFAFCEPNLTKEILWLLNNLLQQETDQNSLLDRLRICKQSVAVPNELEPMLT